MSGDDGYFCIRVEDVVDDRPKAIRVLVDADDPVAEIMGNRYAWVPKSQIVSSSPVRKLSDKGDLHITMWLAKEKGW